MNEPGTDLQNAAGTAASNETVADLRGLVNLLFASLLVSSATLTTLLGVQAHRASAESAVLKAQAGQLSKAMQQEEANDKAVFAKLEEFGRTHPDFQKIVLSKYESTTTSPAATKK